MCPPASASSAPSEPCTASRQPAPNRATHEVCTDTRAPPSVRAVNAELSALDACSGPFGPGQVGSRVAMAPRTSVSSPNVQRSTSTVCRPCTRNELAPFAASAHQPDPATAACCVNVG